MAAENPSVDQTGKPVAPVKKLPEVDDDTLDMVKEFQDQLREGTVNVKNLVYIFTVLGIALCADQYAPHTFRRKGPNHLCEAGRGPPLRWPHRARGHHDDGA